MPGTPDPSGHSSHSEGALLDSGAGGLLEIVVSQRDRFRQRAVQLEEEKGEANCMVNPYSAEAFDAVPCLILLLLFIVHHTYIVIFDCSILSITCRCVFSITCCCIYLFWLKAS